jgi:Ion channel
VDSSVTAAIDSQCRGERTPICDPERMEPAPSRRQRLIERAEAKPPSLWRALGAIVVATLVFVLLGAVAMRLVEPDIFTNMGDALWFSVVTVSTVGYGDLVPESGVGRFVASVIMIFGLAFVPGVTAIVINTAMVRRDAQRGQRQATPASEPDVGGSDGLGDTHR